MGKKGWWDQIQNDDYPETQTNYGDHRAANWKPQGNIKSSKTSENEPIKIKLEEECRNCRRTYWIDKGCYHFGYHQ